MDEWVQKGYISKGYAKHLFSPVIVPKKGKAKFRICFNFQPLNEALLGIWFPTKDADWIISKMRVAYYLCIIDMPAAH